MDLKPLIYLIISLAIIYLLIRKKTDLLQVYVFLLPFHAWFIDIGLNLTVLQVITILMLFQIVFASPILVIPKAKNSFLNIFIGYAVLVTVLMSLFFIKDYIEIGGYMRSEGRFIAQIILLFLNFLIIPLSRKYIKTLSDIYPLTKIYIYALLFLVMLGYIQMVVFFITGQDIFPLSFKEDGSVRTGMWSMASTNFIRISSLGGEPKNFSMSLVIGYFVIAVSNYYKIYITRRDNLVKLLFLFTSVLTLSASGIIMFFILMAFFIVFKLKNFKGRVKISVLNILITASVLGLLGYVYSQNANIINTALNERIFDRNITNEDYDYPIKIFLQKHPEYLLFGSGLGNIHNLAFSYIPIETSHYMENSIFVAKSGYLKLISELGIIGFILFSAIVFKLFFKLKHLNITMPGSLKSILNTITLLLIILYLAYLARAYMTNELIFFIAISNTMLLIIRANKKQSTQLTN